MRADAIIVPKCIQVSGPLRIRHGLRLFCRQVAGCRGVRLIQLGHTCHRGNIIGIIEVKAGFTGHCQNSTRIDIHDDAGGIIGAVPLMLVVLEFLVEFLQIFFTNALNICIQCQHQVISVCRLDRGLLLIEGLVHITVCTSRDAVECIIVVFFQTVCADIVADRKTDHIRSEGTAGIGANIAVLKPDSLNVAVFKGRILNGIRVLSLFFRLLLQRLPFGFLRFDAFSILLVKVLFVLIGKVLAGYIVL